MARVFVTNHPGDLDFSKAEKFGTLVFLTKGRLNIYNPAEVANAVMHGLPEDYDPTEDLVLLAGGMLSIFFAGLYFPSYTMVRLLVYDAKERDYIVRTIDLNGEEDDATDAGRTGASPQVVD